jgi:acetyl esterase/lipase
MSPNISFYRTQPIWKIFLVIILICVIAIHLTLSESVSQPKQKMPYSKTTYTYKVVDKCKIKADVYRSNDQKIRPALMWIHGGALIIGNRGQLKLEQLEMYIKAGLSIVSIDYRLAPETKLSEIVQDIEDAYQWLRTEGPELFKIDPDRIVVAGASAGGYLTLTAGFRVQPRPKGLISFYGYGNLIIYIKKTRLCQSNRLIVPSEIR